MNILNMLILIMMIYRCGMALRVDVAVDVEKEPEIVKILRESV